MVRVNRAVLSGLALVGVLLVVHEHRSAVDSAAAQTPAAGAPAARPQLTMVLPLGPADRNADHGE